MGLHYVSLNTNELQISVFIDASFVENSDHSSQLGFLITLMVNNNRANIIHYSPFKSKRITRSVIAAELYAMMAGFYASSVIGATMSKLFGKKIPLRIFTDSKLQYSHGGHLSPGCPKCVHPTG